MLIRINAKDTRFLFGGDASDDDGAKVKARFL